MRQRPNRIVLCCVFALMAIACRNGAATPGADDKPAIDALEAEASTGNRTPVVTFVTDKGHLPVVVEIARDADSREQGLMHRKKLEPLHGMIFIFDTTEEHPFWMKNTLIPLDMFFINEQLEVVGIVERAEPLTESMRTVPVPSRYVVELIGGFAEKYGIEVGTRVLLQDVL